MLRRTITCNACGLQARKKEEQEEERKKLKQVWMPVWITLCIC